MVPPKFPHHFHAGTLQYITCIKRISLLWFRKPAPVGTSTKTHNQKRLQPMTFSLCGGISVYFSHSQPLLYNTFILPYIKGKSSKISMQVCMQKMYGYFYFFRTSYKMMLFPLFFLHFQHNTGILIVYGFF